MNCLYFDKNQNGEFDCVVVVIKKSVSTEAEATQQSKVEPPSGDKGVWYTKMKLEQSPGRICCQKVQKMLLHLAQAENSNGFFEYHPTSFFKNNTAAECGGFFPVPVYQPGSAFPAHCNSTAAALGTVVCMQRGESEKMIQRH